MNSIGFIGNLFQTAPDNTVLTLFSTCTPSSIPRSFIYKLPINMQIYSMECIRNSFQKRRLLQHTMQHLGRLFWSRDWRCGHDGRWHHRRLCLLSANIWSVSCVPPVPFAVQPNGDLRSVSFVHALEFVVAHWNHVGNRSRCLVGLCAFRHCRSGCPQRASTYISTTFQTLQLRAWPFKAVGCECAATLYKSAACPCTRIWAT